MTAVTPHPHPTPRPARRNQIPYQSIKSLGDAEALRIFIGVLEGDDALRGIRTVNGLAAMGARAKPALPALERAMVKWKGMMTFMKSAQPAHKKIQEAK